MLDIRQKEVVFYGMPKKKFTKDPSGYKAAKAYLMEEHGMPEERFFSAGIHYVVDLANQMSEESAVAKRPARKRRASPKNDEEPWRKPVTMEEVTPADRARKAAAGDPKA
jgi:hypothetical protein